MGIFKDITGYDSIGDMTDGGGPGAASPDQNNKQYDNDNDSTNDVGGIAAVSNIVTGNSSANTGTEDDDGRIVNNTDGTSAVRTALTTQQKVAKAALIVAFPAVALAVEGLTYVNKKLQGLDPRDPEQKHATDNQDGSQVFKSASGTFYKLNIVGLPYEVKQTYVSGADPMDSIGEQVWTDALSIVDPTTGKTGYETNNEIVQFDKDNDGPVYNQAVLEQVAETGGTEEGANLYGVDAILEMAKQAGLVETQLEMEALLADPEKFLSDRNLKIEDLIEEVDGDAAGTTLDPNSSNYALGDDPSFTAVQSDTTGAVESVVNPGSETYTVSTSSDLLDSTFDVNAAIGTIDDDNLVDASAIEIDIKAEAAGTGVLGNALNEFASQNISTIIDTTTAAGKLLADRLGEGNYTDSKTTILGQMKIISNEFVDSNGNPKIPVWAQKTASDIQRTIAFSGISGTAATAAYANAIMEATLGIADKEALFFQTITTKNLDNRQEAIINKAKILSNFELGNLTVRSAAAVQNAKAFLEMDLTNLTREQEADVINKQAKTQALFEDQKAINAQRLFTAKESNDMVTLYAEINASIEKHNLSEKNAMLRSNTTETNDSLAFNAEIKQQRQEFYADMQFAIDTATAKWRQTVETTNTTQTNAAITSDVKNSLDISIEAQNRLWDAVDNLFDNIFKDASDEATRDMQILVAQIKAQSNQPVTEDESSLDKIISTTVKIKKVYDVLTTSDVRLKTNIKKVDTLKGINFYEWDWNEEGLRVGADRHPTFGVLAQEIQKTHPEAVLMGDNGYLMVNYGMIIDGV